MAEMTGGELLLRALHAEGVRFIWAIPDGTYMIFLEALERLGDTLDMHLRVPAHEAAAAHAADAQTRVTGEPAVVMACAGPGAANVFSGVLCAQDEGSPVIAITTTRRSDIAYPHMGGMQVLDQVAYFKPGVKWSAQVGQWRRIPDMVRQAFRVATSGRPGPVHLDFPEDILMQRGDPETVHLWPKDASRAPASAPADPDCIAQAADLLVNATLPSLHCGGGTQRAGAGEEIRALVEYLGCPVTIGAGARGIVPDDHPHAFTPVSPATAMVHNMSDVVLTVGSRLGELDLWGRAPVWGDPAEQQIIQLDVDPQHIGLNRPAAVSLVGDARAVVPQLLDAVRNRTPAREPHAQLEMFRSVDDEWRSELNEHMSDRSRTPMISGQIYQVCNDVFPDDAIMAMDGGNTCMWGANYHRARRQRSFLWTSHAGHLGTGLPFAIGAKLVAPDRPVYCITGDSAFRFNMQELTTAVLYRLSVIIIVAVDGAYGMEKMAQKRVWGREAPWFGSEHAAIRYDRVAEAMGCAGVFVESADALQAAVRDALARKDQPTVIHAVVDPVANIDPPGSALWAAARSGNLG